MAEGVWESNDRTYRAFAHEQMSELRMLVNEVKQQWPVGAPMSIENASESYPTLAALARKRDRASDATRLYAAMAVEGFVNFYGVLRLGQDVFDEHFERLGMIPKLQRLLLIGENIKLYKNHEVVVALERVSRSRNSLVHPKAREMPAKAISKERTSIPMPEQAEESVRCMEAFFDGFAVLVPGMKPYLKRKLFTG